MHRLDIDAIPRSPVPRARGTPLSSSRQWNTFTRKGKGDDSHQIRFHRQVFVVCLHWIGTKAIGGVTRDIGDSKARDAKLTAIWNQYDEIVRTSISVSLPGYDRRTVLWYLA